LRCLALNDRRFVAFVLGLGTDTVAYSRLDPRTHALVRLAALAAIGTSVSCYHESVEAALSSGASADEIVGILIAMAPAVGIGRVVSAAPDIALALGFDVLAALEA